jgi:glycosyltransferase involved in cell wall biosynthesis
VATAAGATLSENRKGYGYACLKGMEYISNQNKTRYCRVLDGDYSDYPDELTQLIAPILENNIDFVVGSRVARLRENSMTPQQILGTG